MYIAPECVRGLEPDHRADIFSLGIVLYEMAAGEPPFAGKSAAAVLYDIVHTPIPPLGPLQPDLPEAFERIVRRATGKDRERRYQSMEELAGELRLLEAPGESPEPWPRILVIEDEDDLRNALEISLSREGYRVLQARNGPEGMRLAAEEQPHMVLLDVMLPGMNGLDVCRELRQRVFWRRSSC